MSSVPEPRAGRRGLGRGLEVLIGGSVESELAQLPVEAIHPNPRQPRKRQDSEAALGLTDSLPRTRPALATGHRMIARLRGTPVTRRQGGLVLDVGGGGSLLQATPRVPRQAEGTAELTIETCLIVREDALQLYGFADRDECELFEQLLSVSGVGPKVALALRNCDGRSRSRTRRASRRSLASVGNRPSGSCSS